MQQEMSPTQLNDSETTWIKYNLHKDGSPIWEGCSGDKAIGRKVAELKKQGYRPKVDHQMK